MKWVISQELKPTVLAASVARAYRCKLNTLLTYEGPRLATPANGFKPPPGRRMHFRTAASHYPREIES